MTMLNLLKIILVFINLSEGAKILAIFPAPSISHQVTFRPLIQEFAKRGHEVTVITPDPAFPKGNTPPNLTEIDVHEISYSVWNEGAKEATKGQNLISQMLTFLDLFTNIGAQYFENDEIRSLLNDKSKQFDLLLIEAIAKPALIFSHIYKVPVIQISSFGSVFDNFDVIGAPTHPILYPAVTRKKIQNLSIWEKVKEIYQQFSLDILVTKHEEVTNKMFKKYLGDGAPNVRDLSKNIDMLFLNVRPVFEGIRPVPPSVVYTGGMHQKAEKKLPTDLKSYLDSSKNGVIYMSFGTNVIPSLLPAEKIQTIIKVFSKLPYNVLWKYDKDELPGKTDNIEIGKWFPQSDLLRHPNIKLFITQGGLQSTDEAITAGVPLISFPILGDQWFNSERYEYHKIGIKLDIDTFTYDDLNNAINTIVKDESYRRNMVRLREFMLDEPMKPLDRAVWWTEYVLRHGGAKHLRSPAANISWAEYLELELVLTLLGGLLVCLAILVAILYFICKSILRVLKPAKGSLKKKKA